LTSSLRQVSTITALALACAAVALPAPAGAEETQATTTNPVLSSLLEDLLAVPAATLPGVSVTIGPSQPAQPGGTSDAGTATPQAYIKDRVVLRTFRGTVLSVDTGRAQVVVRTKRRRASGRIVKRRQTFGLTGARLTVADNNGDGTAGISDIERGDQVRLRAAVGRGPLRAAVPLAVHSFVDKGKPVRTKRRGRKLKSR
jgi:hypothetical protein